MKRWTVRDRARIEDVVALAGGDDRAIEDGRVFVGKARAKRGQLPMPGDEVIIHAKETAPAGEIAVLHHAGGILAVDKPAGISTIPDQHDAEGSLLHRVARAADVDAGLLHPTSRLDRGVSGVVVFAENASVRERLRQARESGAYHRRYVALASMAPSPPSGTWAAPIGRARDPKKRVVSGRDAVPALTRYRVVARTTSAALLSIEPETGRTHRIRVHVSHAGCPLLGDRDYGGPRTVVLPTGKVLALGRVGLHCAEVRVLGLELHAPIPAELRRWWTELGGADDDWLVD